MPNSVLRILYSPISQVAAFKVKGIKLSDSKICDNAKPSITTLVFIAESIILLFAIILNSTVINCPIVPLILKPFILTVPN